MKTLILDNYDSFSYNLYQLIGELDAPPLVVRNDQVSLAEVRAHAPDRIVISPGPGSPATAGYFGVCGEVITELGPTTPILGVCLGLQGIAWALGGQVVRAPRPMHGKTSVVEHYGDRLFDDLPRRFEAMRYHSLMVAIEALPPVLEVTARTDDGVIMAVRHRTQPVVGVQFHPESVGTPAGRQILANFMRG